MSDQWWYRPHIELTINTLIFVYHENILFNLFIIYNNNIIKRFLLSTLLNRLIQYINKIINIIEIYMNLILGLIYQFSNILILSSHLLVSYQI